MALSLVKEFKQKQKISLTPLLKKSTDLLQLSRYELIQKIDHEIDINPFVEKEISEDFDIDENYNDANFDFNVAAVENLRDTLINQINDLRLEDKDKEIALTIVDCIDESGQLIDDIDEINKMVQGKTAVQDIEDILLNIIHNLEPIGIGYRNFKECIKIQINKKDFNKKIKQLCLEMLNQNQLDSLNEINSIFLNKGFDESDIEKAMLEIKSCDLSPGLNF